MARKTYEYLSSVSVIGPNNMAHEVSENLNNFLNTMGKKGWTIAGTHTYKHDESNILITILQREIES